ncbi:nucleotide-binding oligomerization domain-containing protein 2 isoform X1 [Bufo gargarizans]|uniref:nucleotide-binding oligomerization domain-containing protein 2 isoform X1 n=1 Tax=Bufo gargarizans TaxID=30331 RepID=UPI001CF0F8CC|nr:nucleotide-binding oligomerization domain-containing protein 2 isoform X1 [Bufo gargarizans]XP_044126131.1 nucleotide-binding oligomerization domain-containing protein 2 isoform X1 [Bufo gargarizans]
MSSLQTVQTNRAHLVSTLTGGLVEKYECLLDHLLSQNVLNWEDYEGLSLVGQPLSTLARNLLDTVTCKGETACKQFLDVLHDVEDSAHEGHLCLQPPEDLSQPSQYLQMERPRIVQLTHNYINAVLQQLLEHRCITQIEIEHIQLPIYSTSQKARRLLDLLRLKGNEPARCFIEFIYNLGHGLVAQVTDVCLGYQTKLKTTISAQSKFLSTYDGSENMRLEDIYTPSVLEIPTYSNNSDNIPGSQNQDLLSIFNAQGLINDHADTVLILGDAGSGKSTLLQQIQHLWANKQGFHNFSFVFPFSCRRLCCITKPISLITLLFEQCCWPPDQLQDQIFQYILDHPKQVLITFDGFDEFKFAFTDDSKHCSPTEPTSIAGLVFNLIQGNLMKDCIKVLTSRPDAVNASLRKYVRKEMHLKGFSEEGIQFFMKKHHSNPDTARDIISLVKANSSLHGLCNIPVFCWIVSKCHKQLIACGGQTPQTMTDMYVLTLKHFLLHSSTKMKVTENVLSEKVNSIRHLGKLALNGLCQGLYVFSYHEIAKEEVADEDLSLGFLVLSRNFSDEKRASLQYYEFIHITFQCFFAALYMIMNDDVGSSVLHKLFKWKRKPTSGRVHRISQLCLQPILHRQIKPLLHNIEIRNMQITATFVAGLFSDALYNNLVASWQPIKLPKKRKTIKRCLTKGIQKHFRSIPPALKDENKSMHAMPEFVWLIKSIYELQDVTLSQKAVQGLDVDHLKMTYCGIGPAECTALAYVLTHLKKPVGIQLDHNSVGDIGIEQLMPCLHKCQALYLRDNNITDSGLCRLMEQALHWPDFQKIALFNNRLTDESMNSIARVLKHKQNFLSLRLGNNCITNVGGQILADGLSENQSINYLGLWGNQVGDIGAKAIADALQDNKSVIWLSLVGNKIGSVGGEALAGMLEKNTVLEELWLDENLFQDSDAILIAESLKKNHALKILKLSNNDFSKTGVSALAEALKTNNIITAIWLKGTKLTVEEKEAFGQFDRLFVEG